MVVPPKSSIYRWIFHCKPSILGISHWWKPLYINCQNGQGPKRERSRGGRSATCHAHGVGACGVIAARKKRCGKPQLGEICAQHLLVIRSSFIENSQALRHPASHRVFFCLTRTPWVAASGWIVETVGNPRLLDVTQGWGLMSRICSHHFLLYLL
jgi:hypothetical protein